MQLFHTENLHFSYGNNRILRLVYLRINCIMIFTFYTVFLSLWVLDLLALIYIRRRVQFILTKRIETLVGYLCIYFSYILIFIKSNVTKISKRKSTLVHLRSFPPMLTKIRLPRSSPTAFLPNRWKSRFQMNSIFLNTRGKRERQVFDFT